MCVACIVQQAVPKAMRLEEVESETASDAVLHAIMNAMRTGKWHNTPTRNTRNRHFPLREKVLLINCMLTLVGPKFC